MSQITIKKVYASIVPRLTNALTNAGNHPSYNVGYNLQYCTKGCPADMNYSIFSGLTSLILNIHFQVFAQSFR